MQLYVLNMNLITGYYYLILGEAEPHLGLQVQQELLQGTKLLFIREIKFPELSSADRHT